jgi:hypothetical protein
LAESNLVPIKRGKQYAVIDDWGHSFPILRRVWDREAARKEAADELHTVRSEIYW